MRRRLHRSSGPRCRYHSYHNHYRDLHCLETRALLFVLSEAAHFIWRAQCGDFPGPRAEHDHRPSHQQLVQYEQLLYTRIHFTIRRPGLFASRRRNEAD